MPELPDVELLRRYVDATSLHRRIEHVMVRASLVDGVTPRTIRRNLDGRELSETRRHGKHLFARAGEGWLRLHFGMTGTLDAGRGDDPDHTELRLDFDDGTRLAYVDRRKFGEISWVHDVDDFVADRELGPDPIVDDIDRDRFVELVGSRRGSVKSALTNQRVLAGLGNVYVDEILFHAGIHPASVVGEIEEDRLPTIHGAMRDVIGTAIERGADPDEVPDDWLLGHREEGSPCPRCDGGTIERIEVVGRSTYVCDSHQDRFG